MLCPKCNKEMKSGTTTFMGITGPIPMICNFIADKEKNKKFFDRKTESITTIQGFESEAFYCDDCKILMPIIK